jgi:HTH-type transcriptional regulator, competence development regulator
MSTQLTRELRKLRIDEGITLMQMAKRIGVSSAFLSAVENGKKRIPDTFLGSLLSSFPAVKSRQDEFEVLINMAREEVRMDLAGVSRRDVELATCLTAFARNFDTMSAERKQRVLDALKE